MKIVPNISSEIIRESRDDESFRDVIVRIGKEQLLSKILSENSVSYDALFREYNRFKKGGESEHFAWMYIINSGLGVVLDEHIYLYRYNDQIYNDLHELIPWAYVESKRYLGDTWWNEDSEILFDLKNLSVIDFLDKYKAF